MRMTYSMVSKARTSNILNILGMCILIHLKKKRKQNKGGYKSDASAGMDHTYSSATDVLDKFGFDSNTLFNVSSNNEEPQSVHLSSVDDIVPGKND
ncbi:MAG: hypothetical protein ACKPKO_49555, partial [Candidatus Fonsibacter sp.]